MENKKNCGNCKFFKDCGTVGNCRRYPPNQDGHGIKTVDEFPTVVKDFWCGEHAPVKKGGK